jgi:hypothetical protein
MFVAIIFDIEENKTERQLNPDSGTAINFAKSSGKIAETRISKVSAAKHLKINE